MNKREIKETELKELKEDVLNRRINLIRTWSEEEDNVICARRNIAQEARIVIEELLLNNLIKETKQC